MLNEFKKWIAKADDKRMLSPFEIGCSELAWAAALKWVHGNTTKSDSGEYILYDIEQELGEDNV